MPFATCPNCGRCLKESTVDKTVQMGDCPKCGRVACRWLGGRQAEEGQKPRWLDKLPGKGS